MTPFLSLAVDIGTGLVLLTTALSFLRLVIGPSLPDRVVALDLMTVSIVAFCGLVAIRFEQPAFLDVALAVALMGFLATVALARFSERARRQTRKDRS